MNIADIGSDFTVHSKDAGASKAAIDAYAQYFGIADQDYSSLCFEATNIELSHNNGAYVRIWDPSYAIETDKGYQVSSYLEGAAPIGDDGNGRVLFYWCGLEGKGLYLCEMGALFPEEVRFVSRNLSSLLRLGHGVQVLLLG